ncbi:uncharacterized protein [Eleutherodactylus coqui]|uniref:uncharacterized protein n=1 Tax=Eleutherodactylus coqui TaxID=57060 RepID=UPI003462DD20
MEVELQSNPSIKTHNDIHKIRLDLRRNLLGDFEKEVNAKRANIYTSINRPSKWMANLLKKKTIKANIPYIWSHQNNKIKLTHPKQIADAFSAYYSKLYNLKDDSQTEQPNSLSIQNFLKLVDLPSLSPSQTESIDEPFSSYEVAKILESLKNNKAPGPDGYSAEYYKLFAETLTPYMTNVFNSVMQNGSFSQEMLQATIVVLPKPGKEPNSPANFRPISLLNTDIKIYAKTLAQRILRVLPDIIHSDQMGFVQGRQASDSTRKILNLLHTIEKTQTSTIMLTLDAEKAFDRVHWDYVFKTLEKFGFGEKTIRAVRALYSCPTARVLVDGVMSNSLHISNGTRQGCPLSPLLYVMAIEPLAELIRTNPDVRGVPVNHRQYKLGLFADDVILTLTHPLESLRSACAILEHFSNISMYKLNVDKSLILGLNISKRLRDEIQAEFPFTWKEKSVPYLGIALTPLIKDLENANYTNLLNNTQKELDHLDSLGLTWVLPNGLAFSSWLSLAFTKGLQHLEHFIQVTRSMQDDMHVWQVFLQTFNEKMSNLQDNDDSRKPLMNNYNHDKSPKTKKQSYFQNDDDYCKALALTISKGKCPMTVGLYVPWGRCKDTLLQKIQEHLDGLSNKYENGNKSEYNGNRKLSIKQRFELVFRMLFFIPIITKEHKNYQEHNIFFEFSAWHCTGCDRLWAGLITTLCDEIEGAFGRLPISLYRALYKGNEITKELESKEWVHKKLISDLFLTLFVILFLICALLLQFLLYIFNESEYYNRLKDYILYAAVTTFGSFLLLQSGMILKVLKNYIVTQKGQLMRKLKRTDMSSQLGFMNDVKKEVEIITSYLQMMEIFQKKKMRVIIKITKLDKCMPDRVVEVLHAINILLSNRDAPFICILAVDPGIIVECVEKSSLLKGMANNGYLFLNRIVTLAFSIPKMNDETKSQYLEQIGAKSEQAESAPLVHVDIDESYEDRERKELIDKALKFLNSKACHEYITDNTITMRRIVNTIIITVSLMMKENKYKNNIDKVTKWVIMAAQWPCSLSWILQCIEDEQQIREEDEKNDPSMRHIEDEQQSREDQKNDPSMRRIKDEQQSREDQKNDPSMRHIEDEQQSREDQKNDPSKRHIWEIYVMSLDALHANRESLQQLLELDGDPDILYKLLKKAKFTVEDANILRHYTINLDHTIQRKIELLQGSFNFLRFKEEKTLNRMALLEMDTTAVCKKICELHKKKEKKCNPEEEKKKCNPEEEKKKCNPEEEKKKCNPEEEEKPCNQKKCIQYRKLIEEHNLNGKALLYSDNKEIREALGMNMGDWVKFRAAFLSLPTPNLYF